MLRVFVGFDCTGLALLTGLVCGAVFALFWICMLAFVWFGAVFIRFGLC